MPSLTAAFSRFSLISCVAAASLAGCAASDNPAAFDSSASGALAADSAGSPANSLAFDLPCVRSSERRSFDESKSAEARAAVQSCVPAFTPEQLSSAFAAIRDDRELAMPGQANFPRRIPWLLPDNGCEPRANQAAHLLHQSNYPTPYFARATGNLGLDTANDVNGNVRWPGHVAPLVRVGDELVVLDPAVDPARPLAISEWLSRISLPGSSTEYALCENHGLTDDCYSAVRQPVAPSWVDNLLTAEWLNEQLLGRDPAQTLGDCPPWVGCSLPEPVADASLPPKIEKFARNAWDLELWSGFPIYVIGSNFIPGLTTWRITGAGIDQLAKTEGTLRRRTIVTDEYPVGVYEVTAYNGANASSPVTMIVQ